MQQSVFQHNNLLIAIFCISFIASSCTQTVVSNTTESVNSSTKPMSNQAQEKNNTIRLGYQKGGIIPIARQRGELERELVAQNIKVEWSGLFDRCATLLQALNGNRADIGAKHSDVYAFWGEPLGAIAQRIAEIKALTPIGKPVRFSVSLRPILGETEESLPTNQLFRNFAFLHFWIDAY